MEQSTPRTILKLSVLKVYSKELDIYVEVSAVTGISPTLDIKLQLTPLPTGNLWFDHPTVTFSQVTTASTKLVKLSCPCGGAKRVRLSFAVGGTNPSFTVKAYMQGTAS